MERPPASFPFINPVQQEVIKEYTLRINNGKVFFRDIDAPIKVSMI